MSAGLSPQHRSLQAVSPHARHFGDDIRYIGLPKRRRHSLTEIRTGASEDEFTSSLWIQSKGGHDVEGNIILDSNSLVIYKEVSHAKVEK